MDRGGVCRGAAPPGARAAVRRLRRLPLVPRDGPRVVRGRDRRAGAQRALRPDQGRPGGAPGHRRDLHDRDHGHDRPRRLADDVHPHAHRRTVLRRHLLPQGSSALLSAVTEAWTERRDEVLASGTHVAEQLRAAVRRAPRRHRRRRPGPGGRRARRRVRLPPRRLRWGAEVPAVDGAGVAAAPPRPHQGRPLPADGRRHLRGDGSRWHVRPAGRRLRPLLGGRRLGRAPLREDAVRQRPAAARLRPPLAGHRLAAGGAGRPRDRRLPAARRAHARGRVRLRPGRRHRGRRGADLRLDARAAERGPRRRRTGTRRGPALGDPARHLRARHVDAAAARGPGRRDRWQVRARLLAARAGRPQPARDDKVISSWNGLAIAALAEAGALLEEARYVDAARECAGFLLAAHVVDGRLRRSSRNGVVGSAMAACGRPRQPGRGPAGPHQATGDARWLGEAARLLEVALEHFADGEGGFYDTADDAEELFTRPRTRRTTPNRRAPRRSRGRC